VQVTHRFHPLFGRDFEFVVHRQNWGEDRVHLHDENGQLFSLPAAWTDVAPVDPFVISPMGGARSPSQDCWLWLIWSTGCDRGWIPTQPSSRLCRERPGIMPRTLNHSAHCRPKTCE
jgi:hypothetical protein